MFPTISLYDFFRDISGSWYFQGYFQRLTTGKNEKEYSWHVPAINFLGMKQLVYKVAKILENYDICENVKFGAILWNFDILSITA